MASPKTGYTPGKLLEARMAWDEEPFLEAGEKLRALLKEVKRVIVGQDQLLERMLVALLAPGAPPHRGGAGPGQDPGPGGGGKL